jgi:hypothetical protein
MNELYKSQYDAPEIEPNEGQRGLLYSNKASLRCPSLSSSSILSKETLSALEELGDVLRGIHKRMISEGYEIINGTIRKKIHEQN